MAASKITSCRRYGPPLGPRVVCALARLLAMTSIRIRSADMPDELIASEPNNRSNPMMVLLPACDRAAEHRQAARENLRRRCINEAVFAQVAHFAIDIDRVAVVA